jgi:hypothetical protein
MATSTMEDSGETTPMAITMVTTMGTMDTTMEEMERLVLLRCQEGSLPRHMLQV